MLFDLPLDAVFCHVSFKSGSHVDAIILEAPYTKIGEVVRIHPLAQVRQMFNFQDVAL